MIGQTIGPYRVLDKLGEGGMGEVYRATDTKLKRQVAIKILPASLAADRDRLARFQREAEVLASLNHPNIASIYGIEETDGSQALVMELVEGEDLSALIAAGHETPEAESGSSRPREGASAARRGGGAPRNLSIDDALTIAKQIADALEAAHEQGIVHRDLKPANVKVRADGTVKVLDFGLAKALEPAGASSPSATALANSPTITSPAMTAMGMILGTAAYMAPEQARGRAVDRRADIWAFGAVLYEMLTGTRAFPGEDLTETLAAVVKSEPDRTRLDPSVPARVEQVLRLCLQKDPKQRVGDIRDVRLALDGAFETTVVNAAASTAHARRASAGFLSAMLAVAVVAFIGVLVSWAPWRPAPLPPETRLDIVTPTTDEPESFALSPDGRQIVFAATDDDGVRRLWLRALSATMAQPLKGTDGARYPFWSPDSRSLGFFAGESLKRLDLGGGAPQSLVSAVGGAGGTWNANGVIVFARAFTTGLLRVPAGGGTATAATTLGPQQAGHRWPQFLPDGRRFLFYALGTPDASGIYIGALDGDAPTRVTAAETSGTWLPSGWLLWRRADTLVSQPIDLATATLTGEAVRLADGLTVDESGRGGVSVAATGLIAYRTGTTIPRQLVWMDRGGTVRGSVGEPDSNNLRTPRVSPDGRHVIVTRTVQGNSDIWLLDGTRTSRLTFDAAADDYAIWSPDGTRIAFRSNRTGRFDLYQKLTSGAGVEERVVVSDQAKTPGSWTANGNVLLYTSLDPQANADLWVAPIAGERPPSMFLQTPFREGYGAFSPDGRWAAYQSNESGLPEIYVRPFVPPGALAASAAATAQWQVSTGGGISPAWRADGKELYYLNPAGAMMAAPIAITGTTVVPGVPVQLFPTRVRGGGVDLQQGRQYDVAPDGRFLINTVLDQVAAPITLLSNWTPETKK